MAGIAQHQGELLFHARTKVWWGKLYRTPKGQIYFEVCGKGQPRMARALDTLEEFNPNFYRQDGTVVILVDKIH